MKRILILLLALCIMLSGCTFYMEYPQGDKEPKDNTFDAEQILTVEVLDVGQADSIFISLDDNVILIDGGNNADGELICDRLKSKGVEEIDLLVATHPHEDHIGGLDDIINRFEIDTILLPEIHDSDVPTTKTYEDFLDAVIYEDCDIIKAEGGKRVYDDDGIKIDCLAPNNDNYSGLNDYSAVVKLMYKDVSFLFMGDTENTSEREILKKGYDLKADVLKVGHHGSSTSSSKEFLKQVMPSFSAISCGTGNTYGFPHDETLPKYAAINSTLFRTDLDGTVIFTTDGKEIEARTDKNISCNG